MEKHVFRKSLVSAGSFIAAANAREAERQADQLELNASAKCGFPNYETGPKLARVVRFAHCTVMVIRD